MVFCCVAGRKRRHCCFCGKCICEEYDRTLRRTAAHARTDATPRRPSRRVACECDDLHSELGGRGCSCSPSDIWMPLPHMGYDELPQRVCKTCAALQKDSRQQSVPFGGRLPAARTDSPRFGFVYSVRICPPSVTAFAVALTVLG